jgi:NitT/TauT family transport system permease protein
LRSPGQSAARRPLRAAPIDLGLVAVAAVLLLAVLLGSSYLRPYDAPEIDPRPWLLPIYLLRSLGRLAAAYALAVLLALATGHLAARSRFARRIILPTLDVLQSVPILGFFPAAVAVFIGLFGGSALGVEAAAVFLIFTSMFWNLAFSVYESLITFPEELSLAAAQFGVRGPLRWSRVVLPAVMPNLVYNSILSWANGWYFLTASEIIAAGHARFTLPGLGSYLAQAITVGRNDQMLVALMVLLLTTVGMHLLVWSPLETWAERFHLEETGDRPRTPRLGRVLGRSRIVAWAGRTVVVPAAQWVVTAAARLMDLPGRYGAVFAAVSAAALAGALGYGGLRLHRLLTSHSLSPEVMDIPLSLALSFLRVSAGVVLAAVIAVPLAYLTFRDARTRTAVLSVLQIIGSVPATALFPLITFLMLRLGLGLNVGSVLLVLYGTFFYVMFNVLSGAAAIPRQLNEAAATLGLRGPRYVARVFLPAVLPSLVTGCVTAWGGGWNAIIFSEYVVAGGRLYEARGIGAMLDRATYVTGDRQVIALSLLSMVTLVVIVNRLFWQPVYQRVAARYKMES